jgi:predicted negative regulator of RcsB-dependent stress response
MRAGAGLLMLVTVIVIGLIVRFGYRLWAAESIRSATEGAESSESVVRHE